MEKMIRLQKALLEHYIRLEGLPMYPVNLQDRSGRVLVRDFAFRIIEEFVEATDALMQAYEFAATNRRREAELAMANFNSEVGDAFHFITETIIYCGLEDGVAELVKDAADEDVGGVGVDEPLDEVPGNQLIYMYKVAQEVNVKQIVKEDQRNQFRIFEKPELHNLGGAHIGPRTTELWSMGCWTMTNHLVDAIRSLKHKPWAQTETKGNLLTFYHNFGKFMLTAMQLMALLGKTPESIYESYRLENNKNLERIKKGY